MIRFILVVVALLGFLAASIPLVIGEYLVSKRNAKRQQEHSLRIVQAMFRLIFRLTGSTLTIKGQDNVPEGAVLYVGNHRSYFDIIAQDDSGGNREGEAGDFHLDFPGGDPQ